MYGYCNQSVHIDGFYPIWNAFSTGNSYDATSIYIRLLQFQIAFAFEIIQNPNHSWLKYVRDSSTIISTNTWIISNQYWFVSITSLVIWSISWKAKYIFDDEKKLCIK